MEMGSTNGLNFGRKIYLEEDTTTKPAAGPARSTPSPRRKTKGGAPTLRLHGGQPPRCQVEGCHVDLSEAKAYYSRHKVCGTHSKSSLVIVGGIEQRFCQQCSRFHLLSEFDQGKRSCRRRLAGHNQRRRKPPSSSRISGGTTSSGHANFLNAYSSAKLAAHGCSWSAPPITAAWRGYQATPHAKLMVHGHAKVGECCHNAAEADSNCALSLLSNQQHHQPPWGSTPGGNNNNNMMMLQHQDAAPPHSGGGSPVVNNHHFPVISFSSIEGSVAPDLGLMSQLYPEGVNLGPDGRKVYLGLEPSRASGCSSHQMHWSL